MSQNLQNFVKFQKFQLENLVDFEKCCRTHIFLQKSEPIQPKTSNILPKFVKNWQLPYGPRPGPPRRPTRPCAAVARRCRPAPPETSREKEGGRVRRCSKSTAKRFSCFKNSISARCERRTTLFTIQNILDDRHAKVQRKRWLAPPYLSFVDTASNSNANIIIVLGTLARGVE